MLGFGMAMPCLSLCPSSNLLPLKQLAIPKTATRASLFPVASSISSDFFKLKRPGPCLQITCCSSNSCSSVENQESPSMIVFIKGLALSTSEGRLKQAFSQFGEVSRVKLVTGKKTKQSLGFGYVWFTSEESAELAVKEMDGKVYLRNNCKTRILSNAEEGKDTTIQVLMRKTCSSLPFLPTFAELKSLLQIIIVQDMKLAPTL